VAWPTWSLLVGALAVDHRHLIGDRWPLAGSPKETVKAWLSEILRQQPFWALLGVVLGFLLGEGSRLIREWWRLKRLRVALEQELRSIQTQIPQKIDVINQMRESASQRRILPGLSVAIADTIYRNHDVKLYPRLTLLERNCLHVIYERLAIADKVLSTFEQDVRTAISEGLINDPFVAYHERLGELLESYDVVQTLIRSYLARNPIDVFEVGAAETCRTL